MPLCAPKKIPPGSSGWLKVKEDAHYRIERQNKKYRIVMRANDLIIGDNYSDEKLLLKDWAFLHPEESVAFDESGHYTTNKLLDTHTALQQEVDATGENHMKDSSAYIACIMTIKDILDSIGRLGSSFEIKETVSLVAIMSSLARQLTVASHRLSVKKLLPYVKKHELQQKIKDLKADHNPITNSALESQLNVSFSESDEQSVLITLVAEVEKLHELVNKHHSTVLRLVDSVSKIQRSPTVVDDVFRSSVYYLPIIDKHNKNVEVKWCTEMTENIQDGLLSPAELEELVYSHLFNRIINGGESNPIGKFVHSVLSRYNNFITENILEFQNAQEESLTNLTSQIKGDLDQLVDFVIIGLQLSFDAFANEKLCDLTRKSLKDITICQLVSVLGPYYKHKYSTKDETFLIQCQKLKNVDLGEALGIRPQLYALIKDNNTFADAFSYGHLFVESASIRSKYKALENMSNKIISIASNFLRKYDSNKRSSRDDATYVIGADDFLPLFSYTLVQANIPGICSELAFISDWTDDSQLIGKHGYLLASLQTAVQFIMNIDADSIIAKQTGNQNAETASPAKSSPIAVRRGSVAHSQVAGSPTFAADSLPSLKTKSFSSDKGDITMDSEMAKEVSIHENLWVLNQFVNYTGDWLDGEHAYNLSLKLFSLVICVYQRYEKLLESESDRPLAKIRGVMQTDEIYKNFKLDACQLQKVNVNSLSQKEKFVFFLNIYNSLLLHCYIEKELPDSIFSRIRQQQNCAYNIGGVTCSLMEIEHGILRCNTSPPDIVGGNIFTKRWKSKDWNKRQYAIDFAEPLVSFALCTLTEGTPPLRVFMMENVDQLLQYATAAYLREHVEIKYSDSLVFLPKVMEIYKKDFGKTQPDMLKFVAPYLEPERAEQLIELAFKKQTKVKFKSINWLSFKFCFEVTPDAEAMSQVITQIQQLRDRVQNCN